MDTSLYGELGGKVKDCFRLGRGTLHLAGRIWGQIYTWDCKQLFLKACSHNCTTYISHPYSYLVAEQLALILFQEDCLLQEELCQLFFFLHPGCCLLFSFGSQPPIYHSDFLFQLKSFLYHLGFFTHQSLQRKKISQSKNINHFFESLWNYYLCVSGESILPFKGQNG